MPKYDIKHDEINQRFYCEIQNEACELSYRKINENTLDYYRTFVPDSLRNQGIAGQLTEYALEYAKKNNLRVKPTCPYVLLYIQRHSQYHSLMND